MNGLATGLPAFRDLPGRLPFDAILGFGYGFLAEVNPVLTTTIFTVRCLAETIIFRLANTILKGKDLHSQKIYLVTCAGVNMLFLIVMRELNLMGRFPACMIGLGLLAYLYQRVLRIQQPGSIPLDNQVLDPANG